MALLGMEIDAEVERARELQADIAAEDNIQLPPRDTAKVNKQRKVREQLESDGRQLRATHNDDSEANEENDAGDEEHESDGSSGSTVYRKQ